MLKVIRFTALSCFGLVAVGCAPGPGHDTNTTEMNEQAIVVAAARSGKVTGKITFYGFDDNDNGRGRFGSASIAYHELHDKATEDLGTYDRPSTFAASKAVVPRGTRIYIPKLRKYYIMEDICGACTSAGHGGKLKVDLYIGGNTKHQGPKLKKCELKMTRTGYNDEIIFNPPPDLPVSQRPLFKDGICNTETY